MNDSHILPNALKYIFQEGVYQMNEKDVQVNEKIQSPAVEPSPLKVSIPEVVPQKDTVPKIPFLGENRKKILMLNVGSEEEIIAAEELAFLLKVLQAVQLDLKDIALCSISPLTDLNGLQKEFEYKLCIGFGILPAKLEPGIGVSLYEIHKKGSSQYLWTDALKIIAADQEKKKLLWKNLKSLFN